MPSDERTISFTEEEWAALTRYERESVIAVGLSPVEFAWIAEDMKARAEWRVDDLPDDDPFLVIRWKEGADEGTLEWPTTPEEELVRMPIDEPSDDEMECLKALNAELSA